LTATVSASGGGTIDPTGTVTFKDGSTTLGTGTLTGMPGMGTSTATYTTSALSGGSHSFTAVYGGDGTYTGSTSSAVSQTVNKGSVSLLFTSNVSTSLFGQNVTFSVTATPVAPALVTPTGTVTFKDGSTTLATVTLNGSGQASYATNLLSVATHTIWVYYNGDSNYNTNSTSLTQTVNAMPSTIPPQVPPIDCGCGTGSPVGTAGGSAPSDAPSGKSEGPVRYFDGVITLSTNDLGSSGFGTPWGQSRSWSNGPGYAATVWNGNGWVLTQAPYLQQVVGDDNHIVLVTDDSTARYFDLYGSTYQERFFGLDLLSHDTANHQYVLTDTTGNQLTFADFNSSVTANERGQLKTFKDPDGNTTSVTSWTGDGKPAEVQRSSTSGGVTTVESYLSSYIASGTNQGLIASVVLRRQVNGGSWSTVREVDYSYYDGTQSYGNAGDLQKAVIKDGGGNVLDTKYYRYYVSGESNGYQHALKYAFSEQSYARLAAAFADPTTATDSQVAPYADNYFQYDSSKRVTQEMVQGAGCSSCSNGLGTYAFSYSSSSFAADPNAWQNKAVETLPDGNQNIVYTNFAGQVLLTVFHDVTSGSNWETYDRYDSQGRLVLQAQPSAVSGYDDTHADLLNNVSGNYQYLNDSTGLIQTYAYGTSTTAGQSTAGDVAGYLKETDLQQGELGTPVKQSSTQYFAHTAGGETVNPVATQTVYRNSDGTGAETTSYSYGWFSGTTEMQSQTLTRPVVSSAQNGPGSADTETTYFDTKGRPIWHKDGDGFLTYNAYDDVTGALVKTITDVDTTRTSDFSNLPTGWTTPTGGGLHLVTLYQVDSLGRTVKMTDPNGNVTYTVYNDTTHEVRTYRGWQSSTHLPSGPTEVTRLDEANSYTETLTMSATPAVDGNGLPTGTEAVSNVQTLSRTYTNSAGQVVYDDAYFNLSGLTYSTAANLGTENVNFYRTRYAYDSRGRLNRVQLPTGTIERTVYDDLGRVVSTWLGTNDTPGSGYWSPTNNTSPSNMVQVSANVYDGGGVGDGNLTQQTLYPGGSAAARVTQNFYDWRDRLAASKAGVQGTEDTSTHRPILYYDLDNLGEVTATSQYDGDGVTITTSNGVPNKPSSSLLRAYATAAYDDEGRVYLASTFSVD
jgi:YD repeat-containing protein